MSNDRPHKRQHKKRCNTPAKQNTTKDTRRLRWRRHRTALGPTFMAAGTKLYCLRLSPPDKNVQKGHRNLSHALFIRRLNQSLKEGPGRAGFGPAGSTVASLRESRDTCSDSKQKHSTGEKKASRPKTQSGECRIDHMYCGALLQSHLVIYLIRLLLCVASFAPLLLLYHQSYAHVSKLKLCRKVFFFCGAQSVQKIHFVSVLCFVLFCDNIL